MKTRSILCFFLLGAFVLAAESCEFQVYSNSIEAGQSVQITGEATGSDFNDATTIEINCNAENAQPAPTTKEVTARKTTYSSSSIPFRAYCEYGQPNTDTTYTVSAKLLPTGVECTPTGSAAIQVKGTGQTANLPTQNIISSSNDITTPTPTSSGNIVGNIMEQLFGKPATPTTSCGNLGEKPCEKKYCNQNWAMCKGYVCNAPYVSNGDWPPEKAKCVTCAKGMKYDGGGCIIDNTKPTTAPTSKPTTKPLITPNPTVYATPVPSVPAYVPPVPTPPQTSNNPFNSKSFTYSFKKGWNMFGLPYAYGSAAYGCADPYNQLEYYSFSKASKKYERVDSLSALNLRGSGIVVKAKVDCTYSVASPTLNNEQTLTLWKGWNLVSVQTNSFTDPSYAYNVKNECTITGGPWRYDAESARYVKDAVLKPGYAYWISVSNPFCDIKIVDDSGPPAFPETETTNSIEPAGTRGRRYLEDAG